MLNAIVSLVYPRVDNKTAIWCLLIVSVDPQALNINAADLNVEVLAEYVKLNLSTPSIFRLDPPAVCVGFFICQELLWCISPGALVCSGQLSDRSSVTASTSERTALATARKRQELSSGMIRRTMVPCRSGHQISGGSVISAFCFRESESGPRGGFRSLRGCCRPTGGRSGSLL